MSEKKELVIVMSTLAPGCYTVKYAGGGELPKELNQSWTHKDMAQKAINDYLEKRDKRGSTNGTARSKSRTD